MKRLSQLAVVIGMIATSSTFISTRASAQPPGTDISANRRTIPSDDFSATGEGNFPAKWKIAKCDEGDVFGSIQRYKVKHDNGSYLNVNGEDHPFIEPVMYYREAYLGEEFMLEYDLAFPTRNGAARHCLHFILPGKYKSQCDIVLLRIESDSAGHSAVVYESKVPAMRKREVALPPSLHLQDWHHIAVTYKAQRLKWYIDGKPVMTIDSCGYAPIRFALHGGFGEVNYRNVELSVVPPRNPVNAILSGQPFVTHSILFDVNKAIIKPGSDTVLTEIVQFMQAHPSVKLEISGHTDADGDSTANQLLSLARANAIKRYLETKSIAGHRLIAKGYGEARPLSDNTSDAGKRNNRRVEFRKISD